MSSSNSGQPKITVLGSINMDLVVRCAKLPMPGETVSARDLVEIPGGKGANQAVAAAKAGGDVRMIGCVGGDGFGKTLLENLEKESIDCGAVMTHQEVSSGIAVVSVEDGGENSIIVVPGANGCLDAAFVEAFADVITAADVMMVQLETPMDSVCAGVRLARKAGVKTILDPAPAATLPRELFDVDLICPNESEAGAIVGRTLETVDDAAAIARELHSKGPRAVAITLGPRGTFFFDGEHEELIPSVQVDAVDTTAAGDGFAGALAVRWAETGSLLDSIHWANRAGALAASRRGAQPSLPRRDEIDALVRLAN